ncbi:MAG: HEPN domain-containing protein [Methanothrix sp.]|nr:HEPN domain-containing protein [Methanothrix sp.]
MRSAISSAYLAVFHSARAVLFRDGVREKSHYCIGLYLQRYVEDGTLEEDWPMLSQATAEGHFRKKPGSWPEMPAHLSQPEI